MGATATTLGSGSPRMVAQSPRAAAAKDKTPKNRIIAEMNKIALR